MKQLALDFSPPVHQPMVRKTDPDTSAAAAQVVVPVIGKIQTLVLRAFSELGPMTARTAERLDRFQDYGFSTIRKRISELAAAGYLEACGVDKGGRAPATVWRVRR